MRSTVKFIVKGYCSKKVREAFEDASIEYDSYEEALQAALDEYNSIEAKKEIISVTDNHQITCTNNTLNFNTVIAGCAVIVYKTTE